ncbi:MAG: hypothetical protein D4R93_02625 [Deltaproteobacteria bacterium]|nr:MAG: hypothetical protein D4R93_02625 [Deltaproteobacteria bacterium]
MTHSLHRAGTIEDLGCDYVIIIRAEKGYNQEGSAGKCKEILKLFQKHGAVNITGARGARYKGNVLETSLDSIVEAFKDSNSPYCVFDTKEKLESFLVEMKEKDFGLSVVVSGLYDTVKSICDRVGIAPHTTNHSLGIWGNTSLLPDGPVLEITTMCGHGMVARYLVDDLVEKIKAGSLTIEKAGIELGKPCLCGLFNPKRAEMLLRKLTVHDKKERVNTGVRGWAL